MLKIIVESEQAEERQGKNGPYYKQSAWAHLTDRNGNPEPHPSKIEFLCPKVNNQPNPYKKGVYTLCPSSFRAGNYNALEIGFLNLVPFKA